MIETIGKIIGISFFVTIWFIIGKVYMSWRGDLKRHMEAKK